MKNSSEVSKQSEIFKQNELFKQNEALAAEVIRGQLMLDSAPMAVSFFDSDMNVIDCNMESVRMFGFSKKADYLAHFMRLMPPIQANGRSSARLFQEYLAEALKSGYSKHEFTRQKIDGALMQTEVSFVRVENGDEYVLMGYSRDLTDVYAAIEREREARETAQIYMDTSPIGMELWDEHMQLIDCNRQIIDMFGFIDKNAFLSRVKHDWASEHISPIFLQHAFDTGLVRYENTFTRIDGKELPCEVRLVRVIRDNNPFVMAYFLDLTDVNKAQESARETEKRAMLMLDATPLACFLVKEDVTAIDCNLAAVELFGFKNKADAIARYRQIFPLISPEGDKMEIPARFEWVNTMEPVHFEVMHKSATSGEYIPCEVTMIYLDYKSNPLIACYMRDMREIKRMVAEIKRREISEEEARAKNQFLARMSHEIRTPLNAILGIADIQLQKSGNSPDVDEAFLQIHLSSNILLTIINDILDLSKVESGKMGLTTRTYDTASLFFDIAHLNLMNISNKNVAFNLNVSENLPTALVGDELRIKQVANNILSNAFKYTREGEVTMSVNITAEDEHHVMLLIEISDTGQGMTQEQIDTLFSNETIQFDETKNYKVEGLRIGMNIANRMATMMGGKIYATSEYGKGSTFYVELPQKIGDKKPLGKDISENLKNFHLSQRSFQKRHTFSYEHMPYGNILVVDDVESNLFVAKGLLMPYGLNVETAISGMEAIEKINMGKKYNVIFMDHMMPEMDGIETAKRLRALGYHEPIVALTANTVLGQAELFLSNGFSGFISKPIDVMRLDRYLKMLVRDRQSPETIAAAKETSPTVVNLSNAVLESFLRDAERATGVLRTLLANPSWEDEDYNLYTINTHGMKSALANIGKSKLSAAASILEHAGRDKKVDRAETNLFLNDLQDIIKNISPKKETADEDKIGDTAVLHEKLLQIKASCENYMKKEARTVLAEINSYSWGDEVKVLLNKISADLLHGEFELVCEGIGGFLGL
ncbi:MAG: ATP-binding protein [Defluviitaleaceae bacterium]|nr:ATP-binding protein [Defluviitaleaceae bacterium]